MEAKLSKEEFQSLVNILGVGLTSIQQQNVKIVEEILKKLQPEEVTPEVKQEVVDGVAT